jgi:hypothetical protein
MIDKIFEAIVIFASGIALVTGKPQVAICGYLAALYLQQNRIDNERRQ